MPFAVAAAGIGAVGAIAGGMMSANASKSAANTQAAAADQAAAMQQAQYQQTRADLSPYFQGGAALYGEAGALFGAGNGNPLVPGSSNAPTAGGAAPAPQAPLTANSQAVRDLAGNLMPGITAALQGGATSGNLAGGYTFKETGGQPGFNGDSNNTENGSFSYPATPGSFQLIDPSGNVIGTYGSDAGSANQIASALALNFGNNAIQTGTMPGAGGGTPGAPPTVLGLNDSQYGIPALGETNFVKAMGANNIGDLAFKPAEGNDFYKALGVNGPADLMFNPTQATLENMPGYQFERDQGLAATQNSAAAKGLGVSGAALKAAAGYAQGLASTDLTNYYNQYEGNLTNQANIFAQNYNNQLNGWNTNLNTLSNTFNNNLLNRFNMNQNAVQGAYSRMAGLAQLGENAAASSGNVGVAGAGNAGNNLVGAGVAQSAGITGSTNALVKGLDSAAGAPMNYLTYQGISNAVNGGSSGTGNPLLGGYADNGTMDTTSPAIW